MTYLSGKVAIVTGAARGIGFVTVQHLLRNGVSYVAIFDVQKPSSETVVNALLALEKEFGKQKFGYYNCDVTDNQSFIANYEEVSKMKNYVDILVNNAGVCNENKPDLTISTNFTAMVKCTMIAVERMGKHKGHRGGSVVNMGSIYSLTDNPLIPVYSATKHAVVSFVRSMKYHNATVGMRIMCMCPGFTRTSMSTDLVPEEVLFDFVADSNLPDAHRKKYMQSPDTVGSAIVEMLEKGKEGEVWLTQNDESPIVV
ncbi:15-hydroxyprostaglandin dehydrogenase [NAD(+)]-like [Copidosoma floridanum]|uniref:15-hydroxyprostaglandin dehydrogenase [NAD(+)]-like n=1 Tax=Copidosoma floridanum TaxID=29053 RepID=UPI0006C975BD|nr:15-hydroxyprostaglandin dehydrogenase [NAD(+)]-like [Copidosoma floridanum]